MHCDTIKQDKEDGVEEEKLLVHEPPRRVFVTMEPPELGITISDYLYPGEGSVSGGSQYLNTYEVPHLPHYGAYPSYHHPPAPSLASSHVSSGRHVASHVPGGGYYSGQPL